MLLNNRLNSLSLKKKIFVYLFHFWLCQVLAVARGLFLAACRLLSSCGAQIPEREASVAPWRVGSKFPDQGSNLRSLHWKADS